MGLFDRISDLFYPYTEPQEIDDIDEGFASGTLSRWDIPWGEPDDAKDTHLSGLLDWRKEE